MNPVDCLSAIFLINNLFNEFNSLQCSIAGISRDSLKSHENFKAKFSLPYPLLSDSDEKVCEQFGVMKLKNLYGKQVRGIERSTFVLDAAGRNINGGAE